MKYLTEHENLSEYNAIKNSLFKPHVSLIKDTNSIEYLKIDKHNGYEYVDLGLPSGTKWARVNVGSTSETNYGNYYQYGKGAAEYQETSGQSEYAGSENPLAASADTVTQTWGGQWHMPTSAQCVELIENTTCTWENDFKGTGVNGEKFTAENGNYIFIPAEGHYHSGGLYRLNEAGTIWTSTSQRSAQAYFMSFDKNTQMTRYNVDYYSVIRGYSIRGVIG